LLSSKESQSLQIRSVISISPEGILSLRDFNNVAIPSNQVGNFHRVRRGDGQDGLPNVAIPSNQVGNFHPGLRIIQSLPRQSVAIPSNQVGNFHPQKDWIRENPDLKSRNPFKSGR